VTALACAGLGLVFRRYGRPLTLVSMGTHTGMQAAQAREEAASLLELAQTVLGGAGSPQSFLRPTAVAKGFAEAMGGQIAAADTPGGGLTVRITLPVASGDKSALGMGS
jgi:hypothetical protein